MREEVEDPRPSELFIVGYDGVALPEPLAGRYSRGDYAGLIFFARNFHNLTDVRQIATQLDEISALYGAQCESGPLSRLPPILSIDHEGGRVQRIKKPLTVFPPMARLAEQPPAAAEEAGGLMARELSALGFNVNYAPVLDVHTNPENPVIGDRAFGTTPQAASQRALSFWRGLEAAGTVRGCGKHFPGHGDTATDSHHTLPVVRHDEARLRSVELLPFVEAVRAGIGMIMTAHVVYPAIDARPATLSRKWLHDILRGELRYDGVIVSDDLDMRALGQQCLAELGCADESQVVVESLLAGCDAFLLCRDVVRQTRAEEALRRAAAERSDVQKRLHEAVARLRHFRSTLRRPQIDRVFVEQLQNG
jgi:beta-N-acetylhexosaminidase